jgi:hypothetical protein
MLIVIFVKDLTCVRIVWRINVDGRHLFAILVKQERQGLEIVTVYQQTVGFLIKIINATK